MKYCLEFPRGVSIEAFNCSYLQIVMKNLLLTCGVLLFSIPCNAELTARLIVSVNRDARFCDLELDVLLAILLVDANSC